MRSALLACLLALPAVAADDPSKVFTVADKPDARLGKAKTLNDYFPFDPPQSKEEWAKRKQELREQMLVGLGLWPLPEKTPLNPVVTGKVDRDGYTVEKVYFASMPGHYVTGNLYRPTGKASDKSSKYPAVLCPHGHWANGRFFEASDAEVEKQLKMKAETTKEGAKYPLQARCANLALMGFVVFHYDMVGYADSKAIVHREGFKDAEAELRLQNQMGLQTWNSIRAYDYVESLPDVDKARIGVTGASGGGTQTFILGAIDDRPAAAFPAVMVGTAMQGGCVCENCSYLRVGTGNVEFAAMFAPRPLAMSGADDWTKEIMTKGFPELKQHYRLLGAEDKVAAKAWTEFPHNYNQHAREFMYAWFNKHLLGKDGEVKEKPFKPIPPAELAVFPSAADRPKGELDAVKLREAMTEASDAQMEKLTPADEKGLGEFRRVVGTALKAMVGGGVPDAIEVRKGPEEVKLSDGVTMHKAVFGRKGEGDSVPAIGLSGPKWNGEKVLLWVHPKGKASLFADGKLTPQAKALVDEGYAVIAMDLLGVGELTLQTKFTADKNFAGYTYGYNRPLMANRVRDVLTMVAFARTMLKPKAIDLVGWEDFGPAVLLARALAGDAVRRAAVDLDQFRFETVTLTDDQRMLPGAVKYGGTAAFLGLCAPGEVLAHNHKGTSGGKVSKAAYDAAKAADKLTRKEEKMTADDVIAWLKK